MEQIIGNDDDLSQEEQISDKNEREAETDDERISMNGWTEIVMTRNVVETQIEAYERTNCELNNDDRAKYEEKSDDKATLAPNEESSRNADGEESKVSEGYWPNWRSTVGLLAGALSQRGRV